MAELVLQVSPAPVVKVPLLDADVHDLRGLEKVADALFGDELLDPDRSTGSYRELTCSRAEHPRRFRRSFCPCRDPGRRGQTGQRGDYGRLGPEVLADVALDPPDLVVVDMQMGNMGGDGGMPRPRGSGSRTGRYRMCRC